MKNDDDRIVRGKGIDCKPAIIAVLELLHLLGGSFNDSGWLKDGNMLIAC